MNLPARLGKYQITEVLGEGAMGVVYKGFDPDIRRPVALKTIRQQLTDGSEFAASIAARFRNEAQAAGRLAHPGIVGVYDYGEDAGVAYIAMEYVQGRSIASCLEAGVRFADDDIAGLMSQLLDALGHAHAQGVWHRDIKPANVILTRGGVLKVADFGIARIDGGGLTQASTMIGTPAYMAPEQFLGGEMDARADLYSAGVLLYVLLTGRPPFAGTADSLMYKVVHEPPLPPSQVEGAQRPRLYDDIIQAALAKKAEQRFPSAQAFKAALTQAIGHPVDTAAWEQTIVRAAPLLAPLAPLPSSVSPPPTVSATRSWDPSLLALAEQTLARYVGPLAPVLVRRAARSSDSVQSFCALLAQQVTDPSARQAFLGRMQGSSSMAGTAGTALGSSASASGSAWAGSGQINDALLEPARQLLARHIGPIAGIVVKKAAALGGDREAFFIRICASVDDVQARAALLSALQKLPH